MTRNGPRRAATRLLAVAGLAWGSALVTRPRRVADAVCPEYPADRLWIARVLGGRLVAQHAVVLALPVSAAVRAASAVDLLHAASMVPVLRLPRYRRAALVSGGVAAAYAAVALAVAPRPGGR